MICCLSQQFYKHFYTSNMYVCFQKDPCVMWHDIQTVNIVTLTQTAVTMFAFKGLCWTHGHSCWVGALWHSEVCLFNAQQFSTDTEQRSCVERWDLPCAVVCHHLWSLIQWTESCPDNYIRNKQQDTTVVTSHIFFFSFTKKVAYNNFQ